MGWDRYYINMRITTEQENILDELVCERLRDNPKNGALIQNFENEKGVLIVDYLKQYGLREDSEGNTAFYIVKTKNDTVLMFFSLKCGELFDPLFDEEEVIENYEESLLIIQALKNADIDEEAQENAINKMRLLSKQQGIPLHKVLNYLLSETENKAQMLNMLDSDKKTEENENISRVSNTYIVPKFFEVQRIVGCEYAFLFAADLSMDRTLINYYNVSLKFEMDVEVGTNKPFYDFACAFMCQKLSALEKNVKEYFDDFNIDSTDDIV